MTWIAFTLNASFVDFGLLSKSQQLKNYDGYDFIVEWELAVYLP